MTKEYMFLVYRWVKSFQNSGSIFNQKIHFSFDGVIGSFAITKDIVTIMIGLGIGAMFVRSLTIYLVEKGTLDTYIFLEHGAHYAIGILAFIMLLSTKLQIPEVLTGLIGISFILLSLYSSIKYNKNH